MDSMTNSLHNENEELKIKLEESEKNVKDFEELALEWKSSYTKDTRALKIEIEHLKQTIEDLRLELKERDLS